MNDIIEIIEDLKEIREAVNLNDSVHIAIDQKIEKYQKILDEFENANKEEFPNREIDRFGPEEDNYDEVKPLDDLRKIINGGGELDGGNFDKENN